MSYRALILTQRPTFFLPFEESGGGVAADITGNGYDGTYNNVSFASAAGFSVFGGPVTHATWNGSSSSVSISKPWPRNGAAAISLWYRPTYPTDFRQLFCANGPANSQVSPSLYASAAGSSAPFFHDASPLNGGVQSMTSSVAATSVGIVNHIAVVFRGPHKEMFINGVSVASHTNTYGESLSSCGTQRPMLVGAGYAAGNASALDFFGGWISNLAAFDRPLRAEEILRQYNVGKAVFDQPYLSGTVLDAGVGASKRIYALRRDTGAICAAGQSGADGVFVLKATPDLCTAICLDDAVTNYEPIVFDRALPQT